MVQSFRGGREEMAALRFCPLVHHVKMKKKLCAFALPKTSQELISSGGWEKCGWGGTRCFPEFKRDVYSKGER